MNFWFNAGVAKWSNARDSRSRGLVPSEVRILSPAFPSKIKMRKIEKLSEKLSFAFLMLLVLAVISSFFIDIKIIITIYLFILLVYSYYVYKEKVGQELIIAFLISIALTSYYYYEYTTTNIFLGEINIFTLVSWTFGLVLLREIYERINIKNRFLIIYVFYLIALFLFEYIGYYLLNIRLNSNYIGLFGLGIIHGPIGLKVFYLLAGPVYLLITDYLKVR